MVVPVEIMVSFENQIVPTSKKISCFKSIIKKKHKLFLKMPNKFKRIGKCMKESSR